MTSESYVIQGLVAAGSFLSGLFVIFRYVINKTTKITENSHNTIQTMSERHTDSMSMLVKESTRAQEKVANAVDSLNKTLSVEMSNVATKNDIELIKTHFDGRHDKLDHRLDDILKNK